MNKNCNKTETENNVQISQQAHGKRKLRGRTGDKKIRVGVSWCREVKGEVCHTRSRPHRGPPSEGPRAERGAPVSSSGNHSRILRSSRQWAGGPPRSAGGPHRRNVVFVYFAFQNVFVCKLRTYAHERRSCWLGFPFKLTSWLLVHLVISDTSHQFL